MNKIKLVNDEIILKDLNDNIILEETNFNNIKAVKHITLTIVKNCNLVINYENINTLAITFNIMENVKFDLSEIKIGINNKAKYEFNLADNSIVNVSKFNDTKNSKELIVFNLNGICSKVFCDFKTISKDKEKYDLVVHHNNKNTVSNINNSGVNILKGNLIFNVSSFVKKGNINCDVLQNSKIINLVDNKCQINPNLYIDEFDVNASHSANITKFSQEEMFYLMSRGLSYNETLNLLIRGFLMKNINHQKKEIITLIDRYWR